MMLEILKTTHEVKAEIRSLQQDVDRIKLALAEKLPPESQEEIFRLQKYESYESFEGFCIKLQEANFKNVVVS